MGELNIAFRKRIGFFEHEPITFANLEMVLSRTAQALPFENLSILSGKTKEISEKNLIRKIILHNEGGLCYELNGLLYLFLIENGFKAVLVRGVVYSEPDQDWSRTGQTHAAVLLFHQGEKYLLDTGFGGNLPLVPVPLTGEAVSSPNGTFRIKREKTPYGDYLLEMKIKHKHTYWKKGYTFDSKLEITNVSELNPMQETIVQHPDSAFNKKPLVTRLTEQGNITLTSTSLTEWIDGKENKQKISKETFGQSLKKYFNLEI
ncbi:arylamine N-acetyltransferase [Domibacillus sp. PGB-M46]|uniref:arylamine N-acetyltransferase family protein n=1 Tax=Domibacillus sp. PGB-M46 TaxID=2910255 RepID=UPI001F57E18A|nr:arylamine N-acetyltransferase [Domibacillus sp. PGB-M46]MCI2256369.1 arylamine N-acetyltransferase [Domibacillus sp. PGB-M46]